MNADLGEIAEHISQIEHDLSIKRAQLDKLLLLDPVLGMQVRYQIECLEPRVTELKRQALRMTKEREAVLSVIVSI